MHGLLVLGKIYLGFWVLFRTFSLGTRLLFDAGLLNATYLILGLVGFIPVIAFITEKPIFEPRVWRAWFIFLVVWALFDRAYYSAWFLQPPFDRELVGLLLAVPAFAATYSYSRATFSAWAPAA